MSSPTPRIAGMFWGVAALTFIGACAMTAFYVPAEETMGTIQKIFYIHLPAAINTFLACMTVFIASVGFLTTRRAWWDDLAASAAKAAVLLCSVVLITGMIWGKSAWNTWWTWSPRLTFSLLLWLLYVVYLIIRASIDSEQRRAVVGAVYGVVAFLDVPLVYLSARLLPDIHPSSITLAGPMKLTLALWFIPVTLLNAGIIYAGWQVHARRRNVRRETEVAGPEAMNLSLLGEAA